MRIEQGNSSAPKKPSGGAKSNKPFIIIGIAVVAIALVVAGFFLIKGMSGKPNDDTSSITPVSSEDNTSSTDEGDVPEVVDEFDPELGILTKFVDQFMLNREFIGHISIPNTLLDIDVVLGADNSYYLNHNLNRESDPYGIPFADMNARFSHENQSPIVTMYGHNSKNGDYFEAVKSYKDIDFYKENPLIQFDTIYGSGTYKIIGTFSMFVEGDFFKYHHYHNVDEKDFNTYLKELDRVNYYETDIDVKFGDNLIALSTCSDEIIESPTTPYRDVLVARKVRPGESTEVDTSKIVPNQDVVMPDGWIKKFGKKTPFQ